QSLGHEVALHTNAITAGLLWNEDPAEIVRRDLEQLRAHGISIDGCVAHGDAICHVAQFNNSEVFVECARPHLGAPDRVIVYDEVKTSRRRAVTLAPVPMSELGLI